MQSPAVTLFEISRASPPDAMCVEPAPWQFSHWIFETFCSAAGMAAKLPACKTVGAVQPNVAINWLNPPLGTVALVSKPTVWQPQQALVYGYGTPFTLAPLPSILLEKMVE